MTDFGLLIQKGYRYAFALSGHHEQAEDLAQAAWIKIANKKKYNLSYFYTTIRHLFLDQVRKEQYRKEIDLQDIEHLIKASESDLWDTQLTLEQALQTLKSIERETLFLHYIEGYTAQEIAHHYKSTKGTILSRLHRSRSKLKKLLLRERGA